MIPLCVDVVAAFLTSFPRAHTDHRESVERPAVHPEAQGHSGETTQAAGVGLQGRVRTTFEQASNAGARWRDWLRKNHPGTTPCVTGARAALSPRFVALLAGIVFALERGLCAH